MANMQSSLDKMVDRLIKIDSNLSRVLKELQKISRNVDTREEGKTLSDGYADGGLASKELIASICEAINREESI